MYALIDCNNFFASCERLFRPDLYNKPIVVLSNNDGCAIARSNEAKALGIKMGEPYFKLKDLCQKEGVSVFSSNYTLYGDLSNRVMSVIADSWQELEVYSIDEAFIDIKKIPETLQYNFCYDLQKRILKEVGIPTTIGIGKTKTLAKLANHIAKKELKIPVFSINSQEHWFDIVAISEIWGVGRQYAVRLNAQNLKTVRDLANQNPHLIRKNYNVVLMRIVLELQGIDCLGLEDDMPKKSMVSAKSFGEMQTDLAVIEQALSSYVHRVVEKMRKQYSKAIRIQVFLMSNRFRKDLAQYNNSMEYQFIHPTDDLSIITKAAKGGLRQIYRPEICYKKVGFGILEMMDKNQTQQDLFNPVDESAIERSDKVMTVMETINKKYGAKCVHLAAAGFKVPWKMRAERCSPSYTTKWKDLPIVRA